MAMNRAGMGPMMEKGKHMMAGMPMKDADMPMKRKGAKKGKGKKKGGK